MIYYVLDIVQNEFLLSGGSRGRSPEQIQVSGLNSSY